MPKYGVDATKKENRYECVFTIEAAELVRELMQAGIDVKAVFDFAVCDYQYLTFYTERGEGHEHIKVAMAGAAEVFGRVALPATRQAFCDEMTTLFRAYKVKYPGRPFIEMDGLTRQKITTAMTTLTGGKTAMYVFERFAGVQNSRETAHTDVILSLILNDFLRFIGAIADFLKALHVQRETRKDVFKALSCWYILNITQEGRETIEEAKALKGGAAELLETRKAESLRRTGFEDLNAKQAEN